MERSQQRTHQKIHVEKMKCEKHPEREAIGVCANCGKAICDECRVESDGKNYCKDCVGKLFENDKKTDLESIIKKFDISLYIGPTLAIITSFLPWMTMRILLTTKNINAFDMLTYSDTLGYMGIIYFLLALAALGIARMSKPSTKAKGLICVGILMAIFSVTILLVVSDAISQMESELEENPFGELAVVDIGIGLILAIIASIIIIYRGYKLSSYKLSSYKLIGPDLSTSVPKTRSRKVLMVLNGILGLWALFIFFPAVATVAISSEETGLSDSMYAFFNYLSVAYLIMAVTYFYTLYGMFKLTSRAKIVYSAFAGFAAVSIVLIGLVTTSNSLAVTSATDISYFAAFVIMPLLVYVANIWYARKQ